MAKAPRISEAEWQVMQVLWDHSPRTANEVVDALAPASDWHPRTVKTLLNRLVNKGAVTFKTQGKRYLYRPKISRATCVRDAGRSFLQRVYGGETTSMLIDFVKREKLSKAEIEQIKRILDDKGE